MTDSELSLGKDVALRDSTLDVGVRRHRSQSSRIYGVAHRHQYPRREISDRFKRCAIYRTALGQMTEHRSEVTQTRGRRSPGHQSGSGAQAGGRRRKRRVSGHGEGSSEAGNEVRYGPALIAAATPAW